MQGEVVDSIEDNVTSTVESVSKGNKHLEKALRYKATMYPLVGAAIGTLIGGPIGLVIGLKAGGCAAIGGGILGKNCQVLIFGIIFCFFFCFNI